jgi:hypothetical protein
MRFQGKRVSTQWAVVLQAAAADGVDFKLNSGKRTLSEQLALYRLYLSGKGNLAAFPSPNAPHIRVGRQNHAIDVDAPSGGAKRLANWIREQGEIALFTVPGEPWHIELTAAALKRLYRKFKDPLRGYPEDEKRWLREYDKLKRSNTNKDRRSVLHRVMKERRQEIWRLAQQTGWRKNHRAKRYASLLARTK